jgi:hypothetical protein
MPDANTSLGERKHACMRERERERERERDELEREREGVMQSCKQCKL